MNSVTPVTFGDLSAVRLRAPDGAEATVTLFGAHLISWRPSGGGERMFCSARSRLDGSKAIRGGIPLIFPQFNERGDGMRHGFARVSNWRLGANGTEGPACFAEFELASHDPLAARWPHQFSLNLRVEVEGAELRMALRVTNTGEQAFSFSSALHTYFLVNEVSQIAITGLQQRGFEDFLNNGVQRPAQGEAVRISGALDRIYYGATNELTLAEGKRSTLLMQEGFRDVVVWNPGAEAAAGLSDLAPEEYRQFVCIEPAMIQPCVLEAGNTWVGKYCLREAAHAAGASL